MFLTETGRGQISSQVEEMKAALGRVMGDTITSRDKLEAKLREIDLFEAEVNSFEKQLDNTMSEVLSARELESGLPEKKAQLEKCKVSFMSSHTVMYFLNLKLKL